MQQQCCCRVNLFSKFEPFHANRGLGFLATLLFVAVLGGCGPQATTIDSTPTRPYAGISISVGCSPSIAHPELVEQFAREWSANSGAAIAIPLKNVGLDVVIISAAELPEFADSGGLLPVPADIQGRTNAYQWDGLFRSHSESLATWNGTTFGIPLMGGGKVLVYRADRFSEKKIVAPETWEDYVAAAKALSENSPPSLPALSNRAVNLDAEFHTIAGCYDRLAINQSEVVRDDRDNSDFADRLFSYQYRLKTDRPRINEPAFVHALTLMREMKPFREPGDLADPAEAFASGRASLCIANLEDLARFQKPGSAVSGKFRIAKLPGSRFVFDFATGKKRSNANGAINRMPYLGSDDWIGVVGKICSHPKAAFEFLTDLGNPEKMGAEIITSAKWGAGPLRSIHTEERSQGVWLGYNLSREQTDELIRSLKNQIQPSLVNHRFRLRLPNQNAHLEAFDRIVRGALLADRADPQMTMDDVATAWEKLWADVPPSQRHGWIRMSQGLSGP